MLLFTYAVRFLLLSFVLAAAIPHDQEKNELDLIVKAYEAVSKQFDHCDISNIHLPQRGQNPELPNPGSNLKLKYVTFGVGTQNYTCANDDATTEPTAVGALATLYDASCFIRLASPALDALNKLALRLPIKDAQEIITDSIEMDNLGSHYFVGKVPFFDLIGSDQAMVTVDQKVPAPDAKNVDWLKLEQKSGSGIQVCSPFPI